MAIDSWRTTAALPPPVPWLLAGAGLVIVTAGMSAVSWLIGPVFLAIVVVLLVYPLYERMRRARVPAPVALLGLLAATYGLLIGLAAVLVYAVARLATVLPSYAGSAAQLRTDLGAQLAAAGIGREQIAHLVSAIDPSQLAVWLTTLLEAVTGFAVSAVFLLSLLLFTAIQATVTGEHLNRLAVSRPQLAAALRGFAVKSRRFLAITGLFAVIIGAVDTLLLWWLGIPFAPLWGLLAAACNFIPYVGFVIGVIPPALLALLGDGWQLMLVVIVAYILLNSLVTTVAPPYFVGQAVSLPILVTLVAVVFWAWVLGPLGAILAIPLTLLGKALLIDAWIAPPPDPALDPVTGSDDLVQPADGGAVAGVAEGLELGVPGPAEQVVDPVGEVSDAERR